MASVPISPQRIWKRTVTSPHFWIAVTLLVVTTLLHYLTPQMRLLPPPLNTFLSRHTFERIFFVLPVVVATYAFRWRGGAFTLGLAVLAMLPRAIWISPSPGDALTETVAAAVAGALAVWAVENHAASRELHQRMSSRLSAISAVTAIVTRSLDLEQILTAALGKVLEVVDLQAGLIFTLEGQSQELLLAAHRGVSAGAAAELGRLSLGDDVYAQAVHAGALIVAQDPCQQPPAMRREELRTHVAIPLTSRDQVHGVLVVASQTPRQFSTEELDLLGAIGNEIGVAIENARLYQSMRFYARQVIQIQEDERARIARELHDETVQMLIVLSRRLELLAAALPKELPQDAQQLMASLQALIHDTQSGVRRFARGLRPPTLDHLGLVSATRGLAGDLAKEAGIETQVSVTGETRRLAPEEELVLFRIAQEALNNARRHAGASRVGVRFAFQPRRVRMTIEDNGCGFSVPARLDGFVATGRLGLIGMDERVRGLGGTLTVQSEPGQGTVVSVDMPIHSGGLP
jgi:signal transduction histidine kinase